MAQQRNSTLRQAFDDILLKNVARHTGKTVKIINDCLIRKVGLIGEGKGWNAALSHKTAQKLNAPTFDFKGQPRMAYDAMLQGE